jgi:uncharacterized membrane protein
MPTVARMAKGATGKMVVLAAYAFNILGYFSFAPLLVSLLINWVKKDDREGRWSEHHRYMLRSFFLAMAGYAVGVLLIVSLLGMVFGWLLIGFTSLWGVYRDVRGVVRLWEDRAP